MSIAEKDLAQHDTYLTIKEFANAFRITDEFVRTQIHKNVIQAVKLGSIFRIPASELERIRKEGWD